MAAQDKKIISFATSGRLMPQEEMLEVIQSKKTMVIGIPKENTHEEYRIALSPQAVFLLTQNGHRVLVEADAGKAAHFLDREYSEAGGEIVFNKEDVFKANIIIKVAPPSLEEIDLMGVNQIIFSALQIPTQERKYFEKLIAKKITAICFDFIKDKANTFPIQRAMSEIAGQYSIIIAANYLANSEQSRGIMLGGFPGIIPTEVVILGAGAVGEYAARAALAFGANVKVFDNKIYKLRNLQEQIGNRVYTSILQPRLVLRALRTAHIVIGAIHRTDGQQSCFISEEMITQMKKGSVIVDVSIDQGGCFETSVVTSHANPTYIKHGVIHYCVPNITSRVPHTASYALSNVFTPILINAGNEGGIEDILKQDKGVRQGVYLYKGILTNQFVGEHFDLPFQDIDLFMAALQ